MSLATRCPACSTAFRVVQDQLKVSGGWVRCGRCDEVFNAFEGLFDTDTLPGDLQAQDTSPDTPGARSGAGAPTPQPVAGLLQRPAREEPAADNPASDDGGTAADVLDSRFLRDSAYAPTQAAQFDDGFADARYDSAFAAPEPEATRAATQKGLLPGPGADADDSHAPGFLERAERRARWHQPRVRAGLAAMLVVLTGLLAAQITLAQRDALAAHYPGLRPALAWLCDQAGCEVGPLRRIEDVTIENSSLSPGDAPRSLRLAILVRNRSDLPLAVPAFDLTLTDSMGQQVARRVLQASDFGVADTIEAGSELPLSLELRTPDHDVTGFTVEAFHP